MGSVIAICNSKFCSFIADSRNILHNDDGSIRACNDNFQNIIKVNSKVLFGAAGNFAEQEMASAPLNCFEDRSELTAEMVMDACVKYINTSDEFCKESRSYMVCGRNHSGIFCLYEIAYEKGKECAEVKISELPEESDDFIVSCAVPEKSLGLKHDMLERTKQLVEASTYHREMLKKIAFMLSDISREDENIGYHIITASIS